MKTVKQILTTLLTALVILFAGQQVSAQTITVGSGSGSITIENASKGQTYTLYKLFDATLSENGGIAYKLPAGKTLDENDFFTVGKNGEIQAKEGLDVSTDKFKSWAEKFGEKVTSAEAENETLVFDKLDYGYYFIQSTLGTTITVDSTTPDAVVKDKNTTAPNIPDSNTGGGKKVKAADGSWVSTTTAKLGDTLDYQITFNATNFVTTDANTSKQITSYTIVDAPADLDIDESNVTVTVEGHTGEVEKTVTKGEDGKLTIVLNWANNGKSIYKSPAKVIISYKATVTKGAQDGSANNEATIGYNTADAPTATPTTVNPNNPDDTKTTVKTYQFTLNKIDGKTKAALIGAKFRLYDAENNGTEIAVVKDGDSYRVATGNETGVDIEAGTAVIKGLKGDNTKYYLEEIKAPDGYNILKDRYAVTISSEAENKADVENNSGAELPSTGAMGTTLFYIAGSILLVVAAVYMISKRRMNNM